MGITLLEYSKLQTDNLQRGVVETFAKTSPVLDKLRFTNKKGTSYTYNQESVLPGIAFRALNEAYDESSGVLLPLTEKFKIMGGDLDIDTALVDMEGSESDVRATHLEMKIKAKSLYFTKIFFDGDEGTTSTEPDGMNQRLTGDQVIEAGTNGDDLTENMMHQAMDAVDGPLTDIFMGDIFRRQLYNLYKGTSIISETTDNWGRTVKTYNGIPISIIGKDNSGNEILDFDETQGSETEAGSCYFLNFNNGYLEGMQSKPMSVLDLGEVDASPVFRTRIQWVIGLLYLHPRAASRLKGVKKTVS